MSILKGISNEYKRELYSTYEVYRSPFHDDIQYQNRTKRGIIAGALTVAGGVISGLTIGKTVQAESLRSEIRRAETRIHQIYFSQQADKRTLDTVVRSLNNVSQVILPEISNQIRTLECMLLSG